MIYKVDDMKSSGGPVVRLAHLVLLEGMKLSSPAIKLSATDSLGVPATGVEFLVEGELRPVMKIPAAAGIPLVAHFRSLCEVDPVHHPDQKGSFKASCNGRVAHVTATFSRSEGGAEDVEMLLEYTSDS